MAICFSFTSLPFLKNHDSKLTPRILPTKKQLLVTCQSGSDANEDYLLDAPVSVGDGFSFSGGKYSDEPSPADKWFSQGKIATYQVVQPLNGDPFIGSLETPITSSPLIAWYLSNLPGYRTSVSPLLRGIEVGLAHGYFLVGPFAVTGPLRNTQFHGAAGSLAAGGLVTILSICLTMYGIAMFKEGEPSNAPTLTLTGRKKEADKLQTAEGWAQFSGGFFFGGISGVLWAHFLLYVLDLPYYVK